MAASYDRTPAATAGGNAFLPVLLLLFVGSGSAALIYEIVWLQMLQLTIGSTGVSLGVLLGTFMGGMCLGSLLLPRFVSRDRHPLVVYAFLEVGIAVIGLLVWVGMPLLSELYSGMFVGGLGGIFLRGLMAAVCLLPPTLLMGATLPAIARWVESTPRGVSWLGFFYGGNIAGAVFGCLLAGFYLLRLYDMLVATLIAMAINIGVAAIALGLAFLLPYHPARAAEATSGKKGNAREPDALPTLDSAGAPNWPVYTAICLSGMAALGAEVVWTRLISLMMGGTVYTFSIILAVFLAALGIGSGVGSFMARGRSPRWALGTFQLLAVAAIAWTSFLLSYSMPYWPIEPAYSQSAWHMFQLDFFRAFWGVFPGAFLWGASFPLALAGISYRSDDPGRIVGRVYAANTLGAIAGALLFSTLIIPSFGTVAAQRCLIMISLVSSVVVLVPLALWKNPLQSAQENMSRVGGMLLQVSLGVVAALLLAAFLAPVPWGMVGYGRQMGSFNSKGGLIEGITRLEDIPEPSGNDDDRQYALYVGEGMNVSVVVSRDTYGNQSFHGAGKVQASNMIKDMRLQRLLGHISAMAVKDPKDVLVVACGAGVTAGSFVVHPEVRNITICDIEPLVPTTVTPMFGKENYNVVTGIKEQNPLTVKYGDVSPKQVHVVYDDGRHFVRTTKQKFDVITSDPIDPWVKGCAAMNTVEYYQMCKDHLNDGGVMTLWIPLYESDDPTIKSILGTFFQVFPNGILFSNDYTAEGYDAVLFGIKDEQNAGYHINLDEWVERLSRPDHAEIVHSLREVGFGRQADSFDEAPYDPEGVVVGMLSTYAGHAAALQEWSADAKINTDRNLRLQYLAGMAFNRQEADIILHEILKWYKFPDDAPENDPDKTLFVGDRQRLNRLRSRLIGANREAFIPRERKQLTENAAGGNPPGW